MRSQEFRSTTAWSDLVPSQYDVLVLPGGHGPGMRQYPASPVLQEKVAEFRGLDRPVGAICHGTIALARATDSATGGSLPQGRRTTCLPE